MRACTGFPLEIEGYKVGAIGGRQFASVTLRCVPLTAKQNGRKRVVAGREVGDDYIITL